MPTKWVPLESSPEIFNEWSRSIGLPESPLSFQDLLSLDPDFLSFVPQPVKAVLLLFPDTDALVKYRKESEAKAPKWQGKDVWWIKQTIGNACGSIGMLHALMNLLTSGEYALKPDSPLVKFREASLPLDPYERANLLEESDFFENAHTSVAQQGQSAVPDDLDDVKYHFICFIEAPNDKGDHRLVELDGGFSGPFDQGECTSLLHDAAKVIQEKYIDRAEGDLGFNIIVLAGERDD